MRGRRGGGAWGPWQWWHIDQGASCRAGPVAHLDRIISLEHVANGGYGPWCLNLSKAFAIPNPEYLAALKVVIQKRHPAWTNGQVERSLYGRYASARHRHVPTVVPLPPVLSEKVQKVADAFNPVTDVKAARHLGLDPELKGFWSHWIIEDLQELTEGWWENSLYSGWVSTKKFEDTGEQTGFMASTIPETGNQEDDASSWDLSDDEDEDATERENILKNAVLGMTQSARYLWLHLWPHEKRIVSFADAGGSYGERPTTPVDNPAEAAKFKRDLFRFAFDSAGGATRIDWDAFTASWNIDVKQIENNLRKQVLVDNTEEEEAGDDGALANVSPTTPGRQHSNSINRKTAQYLSHFWVQSKKSTNAKLTMEPHQQRMSQLQQEQRVVCPEGRPGTLADCTVTGFTHEGRAVGFPFVGPTSDVAQPTPPPPPMDQGESAAVRLAATARQAALAGGGGGAGDVAGAGDTSQGPMHQSTTPGLAGGAGLQWAVMEREGGPLPLATAASAQKQAKREDYWVTRYSTTDLTELDASRYIQHASLMASTASKYIQQTWRKVHPIQKKSWAYYVWSGRET
eukprot:jgi/Undpi1/3830/HiC_scaffold_16.g07199.m1